MRIRILLAAVAATVFVGGFVSSQDSPTTATAIEEKLPIEEFSKIRASNGLGFLQGEENEHAFLQALENLAAKEEGRPPVKISIDSQSTQQHDQQRNSQRDQLAGSLRHSAALLDQRANELEQDRSFLQADRNRNLAQLLRLEARAVETHQP